MSRRRWRQTNSPKLPRIGAKKSKKTPASGNVAKSPPTRPAPRGNASKSPTAARPGRRCVACRRSRPSPSAKSRGAGPLRPAMTSESRRRTKRAQKSRGVTHENAPAFLLRVVITYCLAIPPALTLVLTFNGAALSSASRPTTPLTCTGENGTENQSRAGNIFAQETVRRLRGESCAGVGVV